MTARFARSIGRHYDFYHGAGIGIEKDFVFGIGAEPHLRWRTFTETMLRFARECAREMVVTLGAYLDEVLYTRPVPLTGFSTDPKLMDELDLVPSRYQGPTGIIGVLADACRAEPGCRTRVYGPRCRIISTFRLIRAARLALLSGSTNGSACAWTRLRWNAPPPIFRRRSTKPSTPTRNFPLSCANSRNANSNSEAFRPGSGLQRRADAGGSGAPGVRRFRWRKRSFSSTTVRRIGAGRFSRDCRKRISWRSDPLNQIRVFFQPAESGQGRGAENRARPCDRGNRAGSGCRSRI